MKYIWLMETGWYYNDRPFDIVVCKTKKVAVEKCRKDGYSYSRKDDLWSNENIQQWRHVYKTELYT